MILGERKNELSEDDYIIGGLVIYLDLITIFVYLIRILGDKVK